MCAPIFSSPTRKIYKKKTNKTTDFIGEYHTNKKNYKKVNRAPKPRPLRGNLLLPRHANLRMTACACSVLDRRTWPHPALYFPLPVSSCRTHTVQRACCMFVCVRRQVESIKKTKTDFKIDEAYATRRQAVRYRRPAYCASVCVVVLEFTHTEINTVVLFLFLVVCTCA